MINRHPAWQTGRCSLLISLTEATQQRQIVRPELQYQVDEVLSTTN
jgi:hypothetical protein